MKNHGENTPRHLALAATAMAMMLAPNVGASIPGSDASDNAQSIFENTRAELKNTCGVDGDKDVFHPTEKEKGACYIGGYVEIWNSGTIDSARMECVEKILKAQRKQYQGFADIQFLRREQAKGSSKVSGVLSADAGTLVRQHGCMPMRSYQQVQPKK